MPVNLPVFSVWIFNLEIRSVCVGGEIVGVSRVCVRSSFEGQNLSFCPFRILATLGPFLVLDTWNRHLFMPKSAALYLFSNKGLLVMLSEQ